MAIYDNPLDPYWIQRAEGFIRRTESDNFALTPLEMEVMRQYGLSLQDLATPSGQMAMQQGTNLMRKMYSDQSRQQYAPQWGGDRTLSWTDQVSGNVAPEVSAMANSRVSTFVNYPQKLKSWHEQGYMDDQQFAAAMGAYEAAAKGQNTYTKEFERTQTFDNPGDYYAQWTVNQFRDRDPESLPQVEEKIRGAFSDSNTNYGFDFANRPKAAKTMAQGLNKQLESFLRRHQGKENFDELLNQRLERTASLYKPGGIYDKMAGTYTGKG